MSQFSAELDVRKIEPRDKHLRIFETFDMLKLGQSMEIINDHDPKPLEYQFKAEREGQFQWDYLEEGPDVWRVGITKL
ncbi:MAG: hemerythrin [Firmicutes bacterium HGW-Firmicutes-7]|nr:MAG: hemerythrin [Firmicutes bacterium HGW-Firmicutes-7]